MDAAQHSAMHPTALNMQKHDTLRLHIALRRPLQFYLSGDFWRLVRPGRPDVRQQAIPAEQSCTST